MIASTDLSSRLALDAQGVGQLRMQAKTDPEQAIRAVAQQFEAMFMQIMLKSMRAGAAEDGLLDNDQSRLYIEMMDQQVAQKMASGKGLGLADVLVRQLSRPGIAVPAVQPAPVSASETGTPAPRPASRPLSSSGPKDFVSKLWPHAVEAGRELGVPAHYLIGHAALESGWGQREIRNTDGSSSHNLFGIKAGREWSGAVAETVTTEYVGGVPHQKMEKFRAYASYEDAFRDYLALMRGNQRYAGLFEQSPDAAGFARGLQQGGYATDPLYASKLTRILTGETLRTALQG